MGQCEEVEILLNEDSYQLLTEEEVVYILCHFFEVNNAMDMYRLHLNLEKSQRLEAVKVEPNSTPKSILFTFQS